MATLPQYDPQATPRPIGTPYDETRVTPDAFGAPAGENLQQLAGLLHDQAARAKSDADAAAVMGAIGKSKKALNDIILDPEKGYAATAGTDALQQRDKALKTYTDAVDDAAKSLTDDQLRVFQPHSIELKDEGFRHAIAHEAVQIDHVAQAQFRGAVDETNRALQNPAIVANPAERDRQLATTQQLAVAEARRQFGSNASPEAVASVVGPTMQKAALDGMEAAVATQDPAIAQSALQRMAPYLGTHERFYSGIVARMTEKQAVNAQANTSIVPGLSAVALPGGEVVPRLDETKIGAVPNDSPVRDQAVEEIQKRRNAYERAWTQTVGKVVQDAQTQGADASGGFSMDRIDLRYREWLRQNAPGELFKLRALDTRQQRANDPGTKADSRNAWTGLYSEMIDPDKRRSVYGPMSAADFNTKLNDLPMLDPERQKALREFKAIKENVGKLEEPVPTAVSDTLKKAFAENPDQQKRYSVSLGDAVQGYVEEYKTAHKGVAPSRAEVHKFAEDELAKGSVTAIGEAPGTLDFNNVRRIDFQTGAKSAGKQFNPVSGTAPEFRRVPVRGPGGQRYTLPEGQVDSFLKSDKGKGFTRG